MRLVNFFLLYFIIQMKTTELFIKKMGENRMDEKLALSWSGGKDACMALHTLKEQGKNVAVLVTTVPAELGRTFAHGEKAEMILLQGKALDIPVFFIECTYDSYKERFVESLKHLKNTMGITGIAYGDLYLDEHRRWGEEVAKEAGLSANYPLWTKQEHALQALKQFVDSGYKAKVVKIMEDCLSPRWLGRELDDSFVEDIQKEDVCPMGESGEYHTFVYDGPLFKKRIFLSGSETILLEKSRKLEFSRVWLS